MLLTDRRCSDALWSSDVLWTLESLLSNFDAMFIQFMFTDVYHVPSLPWSKIDRFNFQSVLFLKCVSAIWIQMLGKRSASQDSINFRWAAAPQIQTRNRRGNLHRLKRSPKSGLQQNYWMLFRKNTYRIIDLIFIIGPIGLLPYQLKPLSHWNNWPTEH